jgi:hypothetical protein
MMLPRHADRRRTALAALLFTLLFDAAPMRAQEPATEEGARAAAVRYLRQMPRVGESMPIVTDTAAVRRELTRCKEVAGAAPTCELVDGRVVGMVLVEMRTPLLALVEFREYQVMRSRCPNGADLPAPMPGSMRGQGWTMTYVDGRWVSDAVGRGWMC